jgi:sugar phosphate isomerase/epimerase
MEAAVFVACSTLCFSRHPFEKALTTIAELGFTKVDVAIHERGPHFRPSEVLADVHGIAQKLRFGPGLVPAAFDVVIEADGEEQFMQQLQSVCQLARLVAVPVVTLPASAADLGLEAEAKRLKGLVAIAEQEGIILTVATRIGTLTDDPDVAVQLCERVPGLGLTLDPSHYIAGPHQGGCYEQVYPFVRHVHLRDSGRGPNQFQVRVGQGEVEYGRIISMLARFDYERILTVEIRDIPDGAFPMEPEVRKLRYLLESMI